jgi:hypothetical protein
MDFAKTGAAGADISEMKREAMTAFLEKRKPAAFMNR